MAKPTPTSFTEEFEPILVAAWGTAGSHLSESQLSRTRSSIVELRKLYRFRNTPVSKIRYDVQKNAAGYLAAFGQRHAYLPYLHLKKVTEISPATIPTPNHRGELTVTVLGAGASVEAYGLSLFYNESAHRLKRLQLNLVEKVEEWKPTRQIVMARLLKSKFPKMSVFNRDLDLDLAAEDAIQKLAFHHDRLVRTDILLVYNVLNEIGVGSANRVWNAMRYILTQCQNKVLVLVAEPNAPKARPRVAWLEDRLAECSRVIMLEPNANITFDESPVKIEFEGDGTGLNDRLFGSAGGGSGPVLQTSFSRTMIAATIEPFSPVSAESVEAQLRTLTVKRSKKGRFAQRDSNGSVPRHSRLIGQPMFPEWEEPQVF